MATCRAIEGEPQTCSQLSIDNIASNSIVHNLYDS
jgi:hypothetical protein